jgi:hypothetical protein
VTGAQNLGADGVAGGSGVNADNVIFGNANDVTLSDGAADGVVARIAKIVIKGSVAGTYTITDHFGFVAHEIGSLTIGGRKVSLTAGSGNDDLAASDPLLILAASGDVRVHEVAVVAVAFHDVQSLEARARRDRARRRLTNRVALCGGLRNPREPHAQRSFVLPARA